MSDPRLTSQGPRATQNQFHFAAAASAVSAAASAPEEKSAVPTASERWRLALLKANNRWCWLRGARPSRLTGQNAESSATPKQSGLGAALAELSEVVAVEVAADAAASGLGGLGTLALGDDDGAETSSGVTYMLRLALSATDHNASNPSAGPQASDDTLPEYAHIVALFAAPTMVAEEATLGSKDSRWRVMTVRTRRERRARSAVVVSGALEI